MLKTQNTKIYDLAERTTKFAKQIATYINSLNKTLTNIDIGKQLIRSSGSAGANYIEAEEALSRRDFVMRIKICRKESKESRYWLDLSEPNDIQLAEKARLMQEAMELTKIFGAIVEKSKRGFV